MSPILIVLLIGLAAMLYGPSLWTRSVLSRYGGEQAYIPGTGGEFARYLLDKADLGAVRVEETDLGDHYDPDAKAVRLTKDKFHGRSLTAVTVAAHEVGHALQDRDAYPPLRARTNLVKSMRPVERFGPLIFLLAPVMGVLTKSVALGLFMVIAAIGILGIRVVVHAVTLPTEFDASFGRALPVLKSAQFLPPDDLKAARRILLAAALTYVAGAAASLLDIARWLRLLIR